MRILIADDQARTRQSLSLLLQTLPLAIEIHEAANGQEAIQFTAQAKPNLVLMDARMPEIDGVEATRVIKANWPDIKIIMLSMYTEFQEIAHQAGADAFVSKGEPPEELLNVIFAMLGSPQSKQGETG